MVFAGLWLYFQKAALAKLWEASAGVTIQRHGQSVAAVAGQALYAGDMVTVAPTGMATVAWPGEATSLSLSAGARLAFFNPMWGKKLALQTGALEAAVAPQSRTRPMVIDTPEAEAKVVGTHFSLTATGTVCRLEVVEGAVRFHKTHLTAIDRQGEVLVGAGHAATAAADVPLGVDWLTGSLSQDAWAAPTGAPLSEAPATGTPLSPAAVVAATAAGSNVVERLRGYLLAPATGDFVFWVASHGGAAPVELWLSPDDNPAHRRRIAYQAPVAASPAARSNASLQVDFHRSATQESAAQPLDQGKRYYLELWHTSVDLQTIGLGWRRPGQPATAPPETVDLTALCPFVETATAARK